MKHFQYLGILLFFVFQTLAALHGSSDPAGFFALGPDGEQVPLANRRGVFVAPPGKIEVKVKPAPEMEAGHILAVYDDFDGLDKALRLDPAENGWYRAVLDFSGLPDVYSESEKTDKKNYHPREYRFKRLDFYKIMPPCFGQWVAAEDLSARIWDHCADKHWSDNRWFVKSHNGQRELYLGAASPDAFKGVFGQTGVKIWAAPYAERVDSLDTDILVLATPLSDKIYKVSDEEGIWRSSPRLEAVEVSWDGQQKALSKGARTAFQGKQAPLTLRFKLDEAWPGIRPVLLGLDLFRPGPDGNALSDASGEHAFLTLSAPTAAWNSGGWQEWSVRETDFKKVGSGAKAQPGFPSGTYLFKIYAANFSDNAVDEQFAFRVFKEPPEAVFSKAVQKGSDGVQLSFARQKIGARFDVSVSSRETGPFRLMTRDVVDSRPPEQPWEPDWEDESPWEFFRSQYQEFFAPFQKVREALDARVLPERLYFRIRSADEAGNIFTGNPFPVDIGRLDTNPPFIAVENQQDGRVKIREWGPVPALLGTLQDRGLSRTDNWVALYLDSEGVTLSSSVVFAGSDASLSWSLSLSPENTVPLLDGPHSFRLTAVDKEGNQTAVYLDADVHITPFDLKVKDPLYVRSGFLGSGSSLRGFLDFAADVKENSFLTLTVDQTLWAKDVFTGSEPIFKARFYRQEPLSAGTHPAFAVLTRGDQKKEVSFSMVADNDVPEPPRLKNGRSGEYFLSVQDIPVNVVSTPDISLTAESRDKTSPARCLYAIAASAEEAVRALSEGGGRELQSALDLSLEPDKTAYLAAWAVDEAGNASEILLFGFHRDLKPPKIEVAAAEQKSEDGLSFDRNLLWIRWREAETEPLPAKAGLWAGLGFDGPFYEIASDLRRTDPADSAGSFIKKTADGLAASVLSMSDVKTALGIERFPGEGGDFPLYLKASSVDWAGNRYESPPEKFILKADRRPPVVTLHEAEWHCIDYGREGGALWGKVTDEPREKQAIKIRLLKGDDLIQETTTDLSWGEEFSLFVPPDKAALLPNGRHALTVEAVDADGNRSVHPVSVWMDVTPLEVRIPSDLFVRVWPPAGGHPAILQMDVPAVPHSQVSLRVDGQTVFQKVAVGSSQRLQKNFDWPLRDAGGEHKALFQFYKEGRSVSKIVNMIVDNEPPSDPQVTEADGHRPLLTLQETEINAVRQARIHLEADARDPSGVSCFWGWGPTPEQARQALFLSTSPSRGLDLTLPENESRTLAVGFRDAAGNWTEACYPLVYRTRAPSLKIESVFQRPAGENGSRGKEVSIVLSCEDSRADMRYDLSASADGERWFFLTRDIFQNPPPQTPWSWNEDLGERWESVSFAKMDKAAHAVVVGDLLKLLEGQVRNLASGKASVHFRVRGIDVSGLRAPDSIFTAVLDFDGHPPLLEWGYPDADPAAILDFGFHPGASLQGRVTDLTAGNPHVDVELLQESYSLSKVRVYMDADQKKDWQMFLPESAREHLPNGLHRLMLKAEDADGNVAFLPVSVDVSVQKHGLKFEDPFYAASFYRDGQTYLKFHATLRENSLASIWIDGMNWLEGAPVDVSGRFEVLLATAGKLSEGGHALKVRCVRDGEVLEKSGRLIVVVDPPVFTGFKEAGTNREYDFNLPGTLPPRHWVGVSSLCLRAEVSDPALNGMRYAFGEDLNKILRKMDGGEFFVYEDGARMEFAPDRETFVVLEAENKAGLKSQAVLSFYYDPALFISSVNAPGISFDPRFFAACPDGFASSGDLTAVFNGQDAVVLSGRMRPEDAPGRVEVRGFRRRLSAATDADGFWQVALPPDGISRAETRRAVLQFSNQKGKQSLFNLAIVKASEASDISLEEPIPRYLGSSPFQCRGKIRSLAPVEFLTVTLNPGGRVQNLVVQGRPAAKADAQYDPKTGQFLASFDGLQENPDVPYSVEILLRDRGGRQTVYAQSDGSGRSSIPYFYADFTAPKPPTLRLASRGDGSVILDGEAPAERDSFVVLADSSGKVCGKAPVYFQEGAEAGSWSWKWDKLPPGDYEIFAYAEDPAGRRSDKTPPVQWTLYEEKGPKPKLHDFSQGRGAYSETARPVLSGNAGIPHAQVQIYETLNYLSAVLADGEGNFSFLPRENLRNGWKNFTAVIFTADGEKRESENLKIYMDVKGEPVEQRLVVTVQPGTVGEQETFSVLVRDRQDVPLGGARVEFGGSSAHTNAAGRADFTAPSLRGSASRTLPVAAEVTLANGMVLAGTGSVEVASGEAWDIRFSPNGDGVNDAVLFDPDDVPVTILQWRRDEVVKIVTAADGFRWDGRKSGGGECEQSLYLAQTRSGRRKVISLYR